VGPTGSERRSPSSALGYLSGAIGAFLILFAATGPWRIGAFEISRLPVALAIALVLAAGWLATFRGWRRAVAQEFLREGFGMSRALVAIGGAAAAAFAYLIVLNRYHGFEVNAWDFSFYDRPLANPLANGFLFNDIESRSVLGTHAYLLLLIFLPLYALSPSPFWLLAGQAVLVGLAVVAAFLCIRKASGDGLTAAFLAAAFLLNPFTARAVQYVFHPEIFYPATLFLLLLAFLSRRPVLFLCCLCAVAAVKEDAILPLVGLAITASLCYRRHRWAIAAAAVAVGFFLIDYLVVLPYFSGHRGAPWYSSYWGRYGASPFEAVLGMASHPGMVASDLVRSGFWGLAATLAFTPFAGFEALLAALPIVVVYSAAAGTQLARLRLYYALPLLPFLFLAAAIGLRRLVALQRRSSQARRLVHLRFGALWLFCLSGLIGPGYSVVHSQASSVPARFVSLAAGRPLLVQGALLPHVGYSRNCSALQPGAAVDGKHGFLIAADANPYPFRGEELRGLADRLVADPRFHLTAERGVVLALPIH